MYQAAHNELSVQAAEQLGGPVPAAPTPSEVDLRQLQQDLARVTRQKQRHQLPLVHLVSHPAQLQYKLMVFDSVRDSSAPGPCTPGLYPYQASMHCATPQNHARHLINEQGLMQHTLGYVLQLKEQCLIPLIL